MQVHIKIQLDLIKRGTINLEKLDLKLNLLLL